jgi:hypothetical protein
MRIALDCRDDLRARLVPSGLACRLEADAGRDRRARRPVGQRDIEVVESDGVAEVVGWKTGLMVPSVRHLLRARDLPDGRYFEQLTVTDLARARGCRVRISIGSFAVCSEKAPHQYFAGAPLGAGGGTSAQHGPLGNRDLSLGRAVQRRLVHGHFRPCLRHHAARLPEVVPAGAPAHPHPDLRGAGLRSTQEPDVWEKPHRTSPPSVAASCGAQSSRPRRSRR